MGVENERTTANLSHLSLESLQKSINNENDDHISSDNQIQIHRIAEYSKDVSEKNGKHFSP
jgi:hypothetical protein